MSSKYCITLIKARKKNGSLRMLGDDKYGRQTMRKRAFKCKFASDDQYGSMSVVFPCRHKGRTWITLHNPYLVKVPIRSTSQYGHIILGVSRVETHQYGHITLSISRVLAVGRNQYGYVTHGF